MIKIRKVDTIPDELLQAANRFCSPFTLRNLDRFFALSPERLYLEDDKGQPLLFIGAFSPSLFSPYKELWMVGSHYLRLEHVVIGKELLWSWIASQTCRVYARAETKSSARFMKFVGFTPIARNGPVIQFEARC